MINEFTFTPIQCHLISIRPSGNARDVPLFTAYVSPNPNSSLSMPCNANSMNGSPSMNASVVMSPQSSLSTNLNQSIRVHSPATATPAMRAPKEVAFRPKGIIQSINYFTICSVVVFVRSLVVNRK